jgi:hypothetical protein
VGKMPFTGPGHGCGDSKVMVSPPTFSNRRRLFVVLTFHAHVVFLYVVMLQWPTLTGPCNGISIGTFF